MKTILLLLAAFGMCAYPAYATNHDLKQRVEVLAELSHLDVEAQEPGDVLTVFYLRASDANIASQAFKIGGIALAYHSTEACIASGECAPVANFGYRAGLGALAVCAMDTECVGVQPAHINERGMKESLLGFIVIITGYAETKHQLPFAPVHWHCCL